MSGTVQQIKRTGSRLAAGDHWSARLVRRVYSPSLGMSGDALRYVLAGGIVFVVYVATTLTLADLVGLPFEVALVIGYLLAFVVHFTLQRVFVWIHMDGFALPAVHQAGRYMLVSGANYACGGALDVVSAKSAGRAHRGRLHRHGGPAGPLQLRDFASPDLPRTAAGDVCPHDDTNECECRSGHRDPAGARRTR